MSGSYLYLVSLAQQVGKVAFVTSSLFGILVIFLTLFGVRKIFGTYKYLMVVFSALGVFLACLEAVFHPNLHFYNNGFAYFSLKAPFGLSHGFMMVILPVYAGVYSLTISMLAVQFVYRYCALFSLSYLSYFRGWKHVYWIAYLFFFGLIWWIGAYYLLNMDDISANYFKDEMILHYEVLPTEIPMMTFLAFDPNDGSLRWWDVLYTVHISSIMGIQYITMIYCGWNTHSKMEQKIAGLSVALKRHHRQLLKSLITCPTIFLFSPLVFIIYIPYFELELSFPAGAAYTAFNVYPAMDSIIVLMVITEYRAAVKRLWKTVLLKISICARNETSYSSNQTQEVQLATM
ncbi:Protein CBG01322 [Caenorhabditis briggsae]|uniref:Protein CBG01322 n=1 Tax=Caenorhabditis briggsae TaxID=6238 RepID=A8WQ50_CAEBR|nr:Protein CBG01322 [Caenorhabditis briggsae]CAP22608.2 Protein CBG01322 [Caenorhabditis briggsae]